ncbi:MAG: acyl-CoA dehydrogenase [Betaproteobacteria bacterium]|nr:MAG: acyl-CoA dehydrogenase [Betaproteobacteria bacterium]
MDPVLYDSFDRLLSDISTPPVIREIESSGSADALEQQIKESGFADAMVAEDAGGAGLSLGEAFSLFFLCGRHALPLTLAPTIIARAVLARQGVNVPEGGVAISNIPVGHRDNKIECRNVPHGKLVQWVIVPHAGVADAPVDLLLPVDKAERVETGVNASLQVHLSWTDPRSVGVIVEGAYPWLEVAAAVTAAQMAGAMDSVLNMTVRYAGERSQFGRPIAKFQAVQQQLSVLAELATASRVAAELGCQAAADGTPNVLAAAVAKARASEAAGTVVSIAHAVHAAMGITEEYDLQLYTRRLIEWRTDYGSAGYWNRRVGDAVLSSDAPCTMEYMLPTYFPGSASD